MLDDLRRGDDDDLYEDTEAVDDDDDRGNSGRFLGMTPVERMLLSILLFLLVTVIGVVVLVATGRIVL